MRTEYVDVLDVSADDLQRMLRLMRQYYENVDAEQFAADLRKKEGVVVLREGETIAGFSTVVFVECQAAGRTVRIMFSGDTVTDQARRNSVALPFAVARVAMAKLREAPQVPLYWLLTSKGYKTFRSLPVFFRDFYPWPRRQLSAFEQEVLTEAAARLFNEINGRLDARRWILRSVDGDQCLRRGVADISDRLRKRPEVAYFEQMNPGHARGDELVCLARFEEANLRHSVLKKLEAHDDR